jgi:hypothetical protein
LLNRHRYKLLALLTLLVLVAGWVYWNRTPKADMSGYVPADALVFIESSDLVGLANGVTSTEAWRNLAQPLDAPAELIPHRWSIGFARWTGIGSTEAVLLARSQTAVVFTPGARATESGATLTIKPLAALVIETHTSSRRMGPVVERHLHQFAVSSFGESAVTRKQIDGVELVEWKSADNTRRLVLAVVDTVAIIGNDESVVLSCIDVRRGRRPSLTSNPQVQTMRQQLGTSPSTLFAFIPKAGVKTIIQAWALSRASNAGDAASIAPLISNAFGNLIEAFACTSRFDQFGAEDRCRVALAQGISQQLSGDLRPEPVRDELDFSFVPAESVSFSAYRMRNPASFWRELNTLVSARSDALTAIAARPLLKALLKPYGIEDPDNFFTAVGPRLQIVRIESNKPAVLIGSTFDKQTLLKLVEQRLGRHSKTEESGAEVHVGADDWSFAFAGPHFLTGPADSVRRCLKAKAEGRSVMMKRSFERARSTIDVSIPIISLTFSQDGSSAISFVELFSSQERSAFSTSASTIQQTAEALPYAAGVTTLENDAMDWSSRSSFGLLGSLVTTFGLE